MSLPQNHKKYNKEELIKSLQQKADELGRTPKCRDIDDDMQMPSLYPYYTRFGSLTNALKQAGLTPNRVGVHKKYSDPELLDILRRKAKSLRRTPISKDVKADQFMPSYTTYILRFGSFQRAIKRAGLKHTSRPYVQYSKEELLGMLKNAIKEAGIEQLESKPYPRYTKEEMLSMLKEKAKQLGKVPTQDELNSDPEMPKFLTYVYRFGSFKSACKEAGLSYRKHGRSIKFTDDELLDMLRNKAKELGRVLTGNDLGKRNNMPVRQVYIYRFGGLQIALKKAGIL